MKDNSPELTKLKVAIKDKHDVLFSDLNKVLAKHGVRGMKIRSMAIESDDCPVPKIRRTVLKNGVMTTIWVCPV